ncbi:MAG: ATP-binding protein [Betaproteobacteria bacterium]
MHQGTVRRSDPGQEAQSNLEARPVAKHLPTGQEELRAEIAHLQHRVAQLQRRCEEADSFAHAVAHDLRSPLSALDGFSSLLEDALQGQAGPQAEQARHLASRLRASAQHMGELIDGLQALARLSRSPLQLGAVDLSALAEQVLDKIGQQHPRLQAQVQAQLQVQGDRRLLRQLLENLFDNARKFSSHSEQLHIELGRVPDSPAAQAQGQAGAFYVRDHGAGFDMALADRLFQPYQRLHSSAQFEGLGLGLAIVQRIVTRHGGRVWAQSAPGQGTTVYFTLGALDAPAPPQEA